MQELKQQAAGSGEVALRIWFQTVLIIDAGVLIAICINNFSNAYIAIPLLAASIFCGMPALGILVIITRAIGTSRESPHRNGINLHLGLLFIAMLYSLTAFLFYDGWQNILRAMIMTAGIIYTASFIATILKRKILKKFLLSNSIPDINFNKSFKNNITMYESPQEERQHASNKILIKSIITAALILAMLIPATLVENIITERQERQKEVVEEVSSKWALPQTVSAPYLVIPYTEGKVSNNKKQLIILPDQLDVKGTVTPENRPRSIYKVLLYKSSLQFSGNFRAPQALPDSATLILPDAKLCFGVRDFRGIEDRVTIQINNNNYNLQPGLPTNIIDSVGLSAQVTLTPADMAKGISFNMALSLRGSGNLHFLPVAGSSNFSLKSAWPDPSFDGKTLPAERSISDKGFNASWKFNAANLPFTSVLSDGKSINTKDIEFGVSLVQPADQYAKSTRSVKYAILIIGLTFAVFFIFELLQKKPVHPVQYLLVGMALVIFYTLLVSISEIILFEYAYAIAAVATIILISLYAKSHFNTLRSAVIFGLLLSGLYGFIYVLISLEDTALLVGSIALFIVLAIIMYVTRKVNWYQPAYPHPVPDVQP